jgi:predicted TIM-barrel fold metal-dependent hydrolase
VQKAAAQMIIDHAVQIDVKKREEKAWYQELVAATRE